MSEREISFWGRMPALPGLSSADLESTWSDPPGTPPVPWWHGREDGGGLALDGGGG